MNINEVRMNKHQEHIEDLVLFGVEGLEELNDHIESFINKVNGGEDDGINVTQKIDGAPAVFVGHNVPGYPEVCVGIKSFLTDTKNAYSTDEEIDALGKGYGNKFKICFEDGRIHT